MSTNMTRSCSRTREEDHQHRDIHQIVVNIDEHADQEDAVDKEHKVGGAQTITQERNEATTADAESNGHSKTDLLIHVERGY